MAEKRFDLKNIIKYFETICLPLTFCELRDVHKRPVAFKRNEFLCTRHAIDECEQQFEFQELLKDLVPSQVRDFDSIMDSYIVPSISCSVFFLWVCSKIMKLFTLWHPMHTFA